MNFFCSASLITSCSILVALLFLAFLLKCNDGKLKNGGASGPFIISFDLGSKQGVNCEDAPVVNNDLLESHETNFIDNFFQNISLKPDHHNGAHLSHKLLLTPLEFLDYKTYRSFGNFHKLRLEERGVIMLFFLNLFYSNGNVYFLAGAPPPPSEDLDIHIKDSNQIIQLISLQLMGTVNADNVHLKWCALTEQSPLLPILYTESLLFARPVEFLISSFLFDDEYTLEILQGFLEHSLLWPPSQKEALRIFFIFCRNIDEHFLSGALEKLSKFIRNSYDLHMRPLKCSQFLLILVDKRFSYRSFKKESDLILDGLSVSNSNETHSQTSTDKKKTSDYPRYIDNAAVSVNGFLFREELNDLRNIGFRPSAPSVSDFLTNAAEISDVVASKYKFDYRQSLLSNNSTESVVSLPSNI